MRTEEKGSHPGQGWKVAFASQEHNRESPSWNGFRTFPQDALGEGFPVGGCETCPYMGVMNLEIVALFVIPDLIGNPRTWNQLFFNGLPNEDQVGCFPRAMMSLPERTISKIPYLLNMFSKAFSFSVFPVISIHKLSSEMSTVLARKTSTI